jgi:hypothetical protein
MKIIIAIRFHKKICELKPFLGSWIDSENEKVYIIFFIILQNQNIKNINEIIN